MAEQPDVYSGSCLCGRVQLEVTGSPIAAGYCHCETCQTWHAAPVNAYAVWNDESVRVVQGEESLSQHRHGRSHRHWCTQCGSGVLNRLRRGRSVVYAAILSGSGYVHKAEFHIHCDEAILDLSDGLPKFVDLPAEFGGSGERIDEPDKTQMRR
jgi:hypothetical protein